MLDYPTLSFKLIKDIQDIAIQGYTLEGTTVFWNKASEYLYGYTEQEALGQNLLNLIIPEDLHEIVSSHMKEMALKEQGIPTGEVLLKRKDGSFVHVLSHHTLVKYQDTLLLFCLDIDITETIRVTDSLTNERNFSKSLIETAQAIILLLDDQGYVIHSNSYVEKLLGLSKDELIGKHWITLVVDQDDQERITKLFHKGIKEDSNKNVVSRLKTKSNKIVYVEWSDSVLFDSRGKKIGLLCLGLNVTEREKYLKDIHHLAFYDSLTELPNRSHLSLDIDKSLNNKQSASALIIIGPDRFKLINNAMGHSVGDQLLQLIAKRLLNITHNGKVYRLDGDRFGILLNDIPIDPNIDVKKTLTDYIENIQVVLNQSFILSMTKYHINFSIGTVIFDHKMFKVSRVLQNADLSFYNAKTKRNGKVSFYNNDLRVIASDKFQLEGDLRNAIKHDELFLVLQPQVTAEGIVIGAEALLRWRHPQRGLISPIVFIPIAESNHLIINIGDWVLQKACKVLKKWSSHPRFKKIKLSVNVSAYQFNELSFIDKIKMTLNNHDIPKGQLGIELTESALINDLDPILEKMNELHELGVPIALDDFGTGYSSLNYLTKLPINILKIDRSFIREIPNNKNDIILTKTIISMAENLGFSIIAEGIENDVQKRFLYQHRCDVFQGFHFSKPLEIKEFEEFALLH